MTLSETIKWHEDKEAEYKELAKEHEDFAMMAVHYQKLAGWLKEVEKLREGVEMWSESETSLQLSYNELLVNYKNAIQLLKAAIEDIESVLPRESCTLCKLYDEKIGCMGNIYIPCNLQAKWRYADEAEKLRR